MPPPCSLPQAPAPRPSSPPRTSSITPLALLCPYSAAFAPLPPQVGRLRLVGDPWIVRLPRTAFAADGVAGAPWTAPPGEMQTSDGYPSEIAALRAAYRLATAADEDTCRCAERAQGSNLVCLTVQSRSNLAQISLPISLRYHSDITPISLRGC